MVVQFFLFFFILETLHRYLSISVLRFRLSLQGSCISFRWSDRLYFHDNPFIGNSMKFGTDEISMRMRFDAIWDFSNRNMNSSDLVVHVTKTRSRLSSFIVCLDRGLPPRLRDKKKKPIKIWFLIRTVWTHGYYGPDVTSKIAITKS